MPAPKRGGLSTTNFVICVTLSEVADVFNVEDLWARARRRQSGEYLKEALDRWPQTQANRHQKETRFSHVIVRLAKDDYMHDELLNAGAQRRALLQDLVAIHERQLGHYLEEGETIRYSLEVDPQLEPGQVRFLFGRAITVPRSDEQALFRIYRLLPDDTGTLDLGAIYPGQRLILLNGDPCASTKAVANWPFAAASLLITVKPDMTTELHSVPLNSLEVKPEPNGIYRCSDDQGKALRVQLRLITEETSAGNPSGRTWTPPSNSESASASVLTLKMIGIGLQRLSPYASAGIAGWRIGFDPQGQLVKTSDPDSAAWIQLTGKDQILGEQDGILTPLQPPTFWQPFSGWGLELLPAPEAMAQRYCGWLRLPKPIDLSVAEGQWVCFGRSPAAELAPGFFEDTQALSWRGITHALSPEQLGLSQRHLGLFVDENGWSIRLESDKLPVFRLSDAGELVEVLQPGGNPQPSPLQAGELLVVGAYVLGLGDNFT